NTSVSERSTIEIGPLRIRSGETETSESLAEPIGTRLITRRLGAVAGVILLVIGTLFYFGLSRRSATSGAAIGKPVAFTSLAVLPFRALPNTTKDDDPGLGITDVLITRLSNVREIVVRPTSAVLKYNGQAQDPI